MTEHFRPGGLENFVPDPVDGSPEPTGESRLKIQKPWGVALRGGYNTRTSDVSGFTGFSLGLGVDHKNLTVDYAFLPFGDLGTTHWITLGYKLGAENK